MEDLDLAELERGIQRVYDGLFIISEECLNKNYQEDIVKLGTTIRESLATHNPTLARLAQENTDYNSLKKLLESIATQFEKDLQKLAKFD